MGGETPAPKVTEIGGVEAELTDQIYTNKIVHESPIAPIYRSEWIQFYTLKGNPTSTAITSGQSVVRDPV